MTEHEPKESSDPFIKASFEIRGPLFTVLLIQNVGKMAAINVKLEMSLEPGGFKKTVFFPLLMPSQKVRFMLPESNIKILANKFTTLKLKGECKSVYGKNITIDDTVDVKHVLESWIDSKILLEETIENRLSQVADKIERLGRSVERMLSISRGILTKTPEDEKKELEEMKKHYGERANKKKPSTTT